MPRQRHVLGWVVIGVVLALGAQTALQHSPLYLVRVPKPVPHILTTFLYVHEFNFKQWPDREVRLFASWFCAITFQFFFGSLSKVGFYKQKSALVKRKTMFWLNCVCDLLNSAFPMRHLNCTNTPV